MRRRRASRPPGPSRVIAKSCSGCACACAGQPVRWSTRSLLGVSIRVEWVLDVCLSLFRERRLRRAGRPVRWSTSSLLRRWTHA
jgi:hypothetical protein